MFIFTLRKRVPSPLRHVLIVPFRDDIRAISQDEMDVIAHDGLREQIDAKYWREKRQAFLNPLAAVVKTSSENLISATKMNPPDDPLGGWCIIATNGG